MKEIYVRTKLVNGTYVYAPKGTKDTYGTVLIDNDTLKYNSDNKLEVNIGVINAKLNDETLKEIDKKLDKKLDKTSVVQETGNSTTKVMSQNAVRENFARLVNGKVLASQLPSYVDDVLEYDSKSDFPATGEEGKIYVDKSTNLTYRWSGSTYIQVGGGDLNIENGAGTGSIQQVTYKDSSKNPQATGLGATAFGGFRGDKPNVTPNNEDTTTTAEGIQSFAFGAGNHAYGNWSVAGGKDSKAYQQVSFAFGGKVQAGMTESEFNEMYPEGIDSSGRPYATSYSYATALGDEVKALGRVSVAIGRVLTNKGKYSLVTGSGNTNEAESSFVAGAGNVVSNTSYAGIVGGANNILTAEKSLVIGDNNTVGNTGYHSIVSGEYNKEIFAKDSMVTGVYNKVKGSGNIVGGNENTINIKNSIVSGSKNRVESTFNKIVVGEGLEALTNGNKAVFGQYNDENLIAYLEVGNGTSENDRKSAFKVLKDGRAKVQSAPTENDDVVRKLELDKKLTAPTIPTETSFVTVSSTGTPAYKKVSELVDTTSEQTITGKKNFESTGKNFCITCQTIIKGVTYTAKISGGDILFTNGTGPGKVQADYGINGVYSRHLTSSTSGLLKFPIDLEGTFAITPNAAPTEPSFIVTAADRTPTWKPVSELGGNALKVTVW